MVTKEELLASASVPTEDYDMPRVGLIKLKGLTRQESLEVGQAKNLVEQDRLLIMHGIAEPKLNYKDVETLSATMSSGTLEEITQAIARLSGMLKESGRQAMDDFRPESGA
jgi:hypothetical protein